MHKKKKKKKKKQTHRTDGDFQKKSEANSLSRNFVRDETPQNIIFIYKTIYLYSNIIQNLLIVVTQLNPKKNYYY